MNFEKKIQVAVFEKFKNSHDPSHDSIHFCRVVELSKKICSEENAKREVVIPAAWLHDWVSVPKNDPKRKQASTLSAEEAVTFLKSISYPKEYLDEIYHAIQTHSFSANIPCETLEAKIIQDADRLDALGAIGIARLFSTSALIQSSYYHPEDPWALHRSLEDQNYALDHFEKKLFRLTETLHTQSAKKIAKEREKFMRLFLEEWKKEI